MFVFCKLDIAFRSFTTSEEYFFPWSYLHLIPSLHLFKHTIVIYGCFFSFLLLVNRQTFHLVFTKLRDHVVL